MVDLRVGRLGCGCPGLHGADLLALSLAQFHQCAGVAELRFGGVHRLQAADVGIAGDRVGHRRIHHCIAEGQSYGCNATGPGLALALAHIWRDRCGAFVAFRVVVDPSGERSTSRSGVSPIAGCQPGGESVPGVASRRGPPADRGGYNGPGMFCLRTQDGVIGVSVFAPPCLCWSAAVRPGDQRT